MNPIPWLDSARLWMIADLQAAAGRDLASLVSAGIDGGVDVVVARFNELKNSEFIPAASAVKNACQRKGIPWVCAHNVQLFEMLQPEGVHLSNLDPPIPEVRNLVGDSIAIGYSAHSIEDIEFAAKSGADYCWFSPVFSTTKGGKKMLGVGPAAAKLAVETSIRLGASGKPFPVVFLGGIAPSNVSALTPFGIPRVAAIGSLIGTQDVRAAAEALKASIATE